MTAPFAAIESRIAAAEFRHLANASASGFDGSGGALSFSVIFDAAYQPALGVSETWPQARALSADIATLHAPGGLQIDQGAGPVAYSVAGIQRDVEPLVSTIMLREA